MAALFRTERFSRYLDQARDGRSSLRRIVPGVVLIVTVWFAASVAMVAIGSGGGFEFREGETLAHRYVPANVMFALVVLLSIGTFWIGVWLALRLLHRRALSSLYGIAGRLYWPDFTRAAGVTLAVCIATIPLGMLVDPTWLRGPIPLSTWLVALPVLLLACLIQASAEEIFFRGYLHQLLGVRFASPLVWLGLPTVAFTLLHWQGGATGPMNLAMLVVIGAFSLAMTALVLATGNLAASIGAHFGNNVSAILLVSSQPDLGRVSLFEGRSVLDPNWSAGDAALTTLFGLVVVAATLTLLLHPSSPVRLPSLSRPLN